MDKKLSPHLVELITDTINRKIAPAIKAHKNPCVLWSSGKDSMVLLHLIKFEMGFDFPVVCYREPWMPEKQAFTNSIIQQWKLVAWDYSPSVVALCEGNGRVDVMNHYSLGGKNVLILARGIEKPVEGKEWLCGRDTFVSRPLGTFNFPWDLAFHGHKSVDVDPTSGKMPLTLDVKLCPDGASQAFPLRHWADEDVFEYIQKLEIPYDRSRYIVNAEGKLESQKINITYNPDYYRACFDCVRNDRPATVFCPKLKLEIDNVSDKVLHTRPSLEHCSLRVDGK